MSDGNFNRALLPSTPYASGMRMGQQQMKTRALAAFRTWAKDKFPSLSGEELEKMAEEFHQRITSP